MIALMNRTLPRPTGRGSPHWILACVLTLSACALGPEYQRPAIEIPAAFKESRDWKPAQPRDESDRGAWWLVYNDPILSDLEVQIDLSNQTLKAAAAAYVAAQAVTKEVQSGLYPAVSVGTSASRYAGDAAPSPAGPAYDLTSTVTWTPDFWGRVRRTLESDTALAEASAADLASARLSLQTELASDYFELRAQDELIRILQATAAANDRTLRLAKSQYTAGFATQVDIFAAQAQLESAKAQAINAGVKRAQMEHAIAVLVGKSPASFTLAPQAFTPTIPVIPVSVPSGLLERRPDIAAAERGVISANAKIGIAEAVWFPDVTLSGATGVTGSVLGTLLQAANGWWGIGTALSQTVFDAGARQATIEQTKAEYDKSVATYRQTVLSAFKDVEDQLVSQRILAEQVASQGAALQAARSAQTLALQQYAQGLGPYDSVITAQMVTLSNEKESLDLTRARLAASIALIGALGGGWTDTTPQTVKLIE